MRNAQGGTKKFCPSCKAIRVVEASKPSLGDSSQRWYMKEHPDIHLFRRGQQCQTCYRYWHSAEVDEDLIEELVRLRNELRIIKEAAEANSEQFEYGSLRLISGN